MARLQWHGDQFERAAKAHLRRNLAAASIALVNHLKVMLNVEGTAKRDKAGQRDKKGRFKKRLVYGANPSKPGEPPHKQTGRLLGSQAWEIVGLVARVGTNVLYGRFLELGTKFMKARPWLRRALNEIRSKLIAIITLPMK